MSSSANVAKAKVVLGQRPQRVPLLVDVPLPDGTIASVTIQYRYRTRTEYGEMLDRRMAEARAADAAQADSEAGKQWVKPYSEAEHQQRVLGALAQHILDIADGWDLDEPWGADAVRQFCDELPAGALAVIDRYRQALVEGRRGN